MIEVFFRRTNRAMPVDIPGDLLADIGVGGCLGALGQHACLSQRGNPHLPILAAHDRDGMVNFLLSGWLEVKILNGFLVGVDALLGGRLTNRFQR